MPATSSTGQCNLCGETVSKRAITRNSINILVRNHPPPISCGKCGQPATQVCVECMDTPNGWLCERHAAQHKHDEMFLPVVNSPRVGMCGYAG